MKKLFSVFMILALVLGFAACGSKNNGEGDSQGKAPESSVQTAGDESSADEGAGKAEASSDTQEAEQTEEPGGPSPEETGEAGTKALVVYFSATGNTKAVAETLAGLSGADIYEIVPEQPYTDEDLNYNDRTTRATAEQNDPDARPAISGSITDFEQYEVVYVGYPIWWGDMPRILYTFFDTYDFSGKTIAPFCTSGGSGLSGTPGTIVKLEAGAEVLDGLHISDSKADSSESSVSQWLVDIGQAE